MLDDYVVLCVAVSAAVLARGGQPWQVPNVLRSMDYAVKNIPQDLPPESISMQAATILDIALTQNGLPPR